MRVAVWPAQQQGRPVWYHLCRDATRHVACGPRHSKDRCSGTSQAFSVWHMGGATPERLTSLHWANAQGLCSQQVLRQCVGLMQSCMWGFIAPRRT